MERKGAITMKGNPLTLIGNELKEGDKAPDFVVLNENMEIRTLDSYRGKYKVISVTPSLDTPVCDLQLQWFNEDASSEPDDVVVLNISMDLPFAIKRFCATKGIKNVEALSDHREASFGQNWGVLIKELRLLARSIFIVDKSDVVRYVQIVQEQTNEPDYKDAIGTLRELIKE